MKKLLKQAVAFVGFSGVGWLLDLCTYTILGFFSADLVVNNTISSWVGVTFVFIFATRKVFKNNGRIPLGWKYVVYLLYQCVLIFFISMLLNKINTAIVANITIAFVQRFSTILSKCLVTPITMCLNFFVMKILVEKI